MQLSELLSPERVACDVQAASKKRVLEQLSAMIADGQATLTETDIFDSLIARERLGSTGLGHGVAIPHGRAKNSVKTTGAFIKLQEGVDFDAVDNQPVDLLFALLVPEESTDEHLQLLSQLAEMFSNREFVERLRAASTTEQVYSLISGWTPQA